MANEIDPQDENPVALIVDDDDAMRDSLQELLQSVNISTRSFSSARDFIAAYEPNMGGCLLVDIRMPDMSGLELQQWLIERNVTIPLVILTAYANVPTAVNAMKLGSIDFIQKPYDDQAIIDTVQIAFRKHREDRAQAELAAAWRVRYESLSAREVEVMAHVTEGLRNKQIAFKLGVSERTVENHRSRVMQKMQVKTVAELLRVVIAMESDPRTSPRDATE